MKCIIHLCCNDHRNGQFQGYVEDVSIDLPNGDSIELNGPRVKVSFIAKTEISIGRVRAVLHGYREWCGNWCWDAATVESNRALAIANYLKSRGWTCQCGPAEIWDAWQDDEPISVEEWREWCQTAREEVR